MKICLIVDSTGLGAFISIYKTVKERRKDPSVEERIFDKEFKTSYKKNIFDYGFR